mgnify:CR=1 FL=1
MKILSCNSNRPLAEAIAAFLNKPLTKADVRRFADMEVFVETERSSLIRSMASPNNGAIDNCFILLVTRTASVAGIESVVTSKLSGDAATRLTAPPDKTPCVT